MWLYCPFCKFDTATRVVTKTAATPQPTYVHTEYRCGVCDEVIASSDSPKHSEEIKGDARSAADYHSVGGSDY